MARAKQGKANGNNGHALEVRHGNFLETMDTLHQKVREKAHEIFSNRQPHEGDSVSDWLAAESEVFTAIAMQVREEDDRYIMEAEVPGFERDEIEINVDNDMLSVGGIHRTESKRKRGGAAESSISEVSFMRRFTLPQDADRSQIGAEIEGGVLRVVLPKQGATA